MAVLSHQYTLCTSTSVPNFGMCPRKNEVDDIVIFEMILIQNHDISVIFDLDE